MSGLHPRVYGHRFHKIFFLYTLPHHEMVSCFHFWEFSSLFSVKPLFMRFLTDFNFPKITFRKNTMFIHTFHYPLFRTFYYPVKANYIRSQNISFLHKNKAPNLLCRFRTLKCTDYSLLPK